METTETLKNSKMSDTSLEHCLHDIAETCDGDDITWKLTALKEALKKAIPGSELPKTNPFIKQGYSISRENAHFYPIYGPSETLNVNIKEYKPVFNKNCALVLCEHKGKEFIFFDPNSKDKNYGSLQSTTQKIRLAAIGLSGAYTPKEEDFEEFSSNQEFGKNGFMKAQTAFGWQFPTYSSIFRVLNEKDRKSAFSIFEVKNPLDKNAKLELLINTENLDSPNEEQIASDFYFTGSLQ